MFFKYKPEYKEVILLQSGIGKANAASTTALLIERFSPELVINTGSAGGLDPALLAFATEALAETRIEGKIVKGLITTADSFIRSQFGIPFLAAANSAAYDRDKL
ncbi:hypothetical protein A7311_14020 [Paenibacillus polymyxa]|nr:hypothetical protein A7311_14020 [Paenibacillus polymyxa]